MRCTSCRWSDTVENKQVINTFGNTTVIQNGKNNTTCTNEDPDKVVNINADFEMDCNKYVNRE